MQLVISWSNIDGTLLLNEYIESLGPRIWFKFDETPEAFSPDGWNANFVWENSGIDTGTTGLVYGGFCTASAALVPESVGGAYCIEPVGGGRPTFFCRYDPAAENTYVGRTITVNVTILTNSDFVTANGGNSAYGFWHEGATGQSNNQGLFFWYEVATEIFRATYFNGGWRDAILFDATGLSPLVADTKYNLTFVYSSTGGSGNGYASVSINGSHKGNVSLTHSVPSTTYMARFGSVGLTDVNTQSYQVRAAFDNCLVFDYELNTTEIAQLSALSLAA